MNHPAHPTADFTIWEDTAWRIATRDDGVVASIRSSNKRVVSLFLRGCIASGATVWDANDERFLTREPR